MTARLISRPFAVAFALIPALSAPAQHPGKSVDGPNVEHFIRWAKTQGAEDTEQGLSPAHERDHRSLKEAVGPRFKIGVGVGHYVVRSAEDAALIKQHFQILTPENCMKPQSVHPAEDEWRFQAADRFADFARANQLEIAGHCLVWAKDDRTDPWMMRENGEPVSRETLLRRIETHVGTVARRYADVATMWDVVNEAIGDGRDGLLRDSVYSRTTGINFIVAAFKTAGAEDPDALLVYSEYSDVIERVSFWNLHDGQSWLNNFPWRRVNYPLLFDRHRRPKPVFDAVYASLQAPP